MCTNMQSDPKQGFTLIEVLIALSLSAGVAVMMLLVLMPGLRHVKEIRESERLHAEANQAVDLIGFAVKSGTQIEVSGTETLAITLPDSSEKTLHRIGSRLFMTIPAGDYPITSDNVLLTQLIFEEYASSTCAACRARSVRMSFTLTSLDGRRSISGTTTVSLRN